MGGYPIAHAMMLMIPEAWAGNPLMDAKRRAFYEYNAALMEPWDGPAAVAFTDGKFIGATLDRNGLRPARYFITDDDLIVMSSEMGPRHRRKRRKEVAPAAGKMLRSTSSTPHRSTRAKRDLAAQRPYRNGWTHQMRLGTREAARVPRPDTTSCSTASRPSATRRRT